MQEAFTGSFSAQQTPCGLDDLPQRVYETIIDRLPRGNILTLRLVNMHNNARVNNKFLSEYVSTRYIYFMDKGVPTHWMRLDDDYGLANLVENLVFQYCWVPPPLEKFRLDSNLHRDYSRILNDPLVIAHMSASNCDWEGNLDQRLREVGAVQHLMVDSHLNLRRADIAIEHEIRCSPELAEIVADTLLLPISVEKTSKAVMYILAAIARTQFKCAELSLLHIGASAFSWDAKMPIESYIFKSEGLKKAMQDTRTINLSLYMTTSKDTLSRISIPKNISGFLNCAANLRSLNLILQQPPLEKIKEKDEDHMYSFGHKSMPNRPDDMALTIDSFFEQMGTFPNLRSLRICSSPEWVIDRTPLASFLQRQHGLKELHLGMIMVARPWKQVFNVFKHLASLRTLRLQNLGFVDERKPTFLLAARRGPYGNSDLPKRKWIRDIKLEGKDEIVDMLANHMDYLKVEKVDGEDGLLDY